MNTAPFTECSSVWLGGHEDAAGGDQFWGDSGRLPEHTTADCRRWGFLDITPAHIMQWSQLVFVEPPDDDESLKRFCSSLHKFTQFQSFQELASLTYGDPTSNCCTVTGVQFDRDGEYFAVAGLTKKIKVCTMLSQICGCVLLCVCTFVCCCLAFIG